MSNVPICTLNNGAKFPSIGFGTYTILGPDCVRAVKDAIDAGFRFFDSAYFYENEKEVGQAIHEKIAEGVVKIEELIVSTKLWNNFHEPNKVEYICRKQLKNFEVDYFDLYVMHFPYGYVYRGDNVMFPYDANGELELNDIDYLDTWKEMEKLVDLGLAKSLGVSNFNSEQLTRLIDNCSIKPVCNQIECHPGLNQKKMIAFCKELNVKVIGYCPLGQPNPEKQTPRFMFDSRVKEVGGKYRKTPAQVCLRYLIENDVIPIPKTLRVNRLLENLKVFDFKLSEEDHALLDSFNTGERIIPNEHSKKSIYFPFNIEF